MARGSKFLKNGLLTSNILFLAVQIFITVFGYYMVSKITHVENPNTNIFTINVFNLVLAVHSCVIISLVLLGCCAAVRGNLCCTITYAVFMGIKFVLQTALAIHSWYGRYQLYRKIDRFVDPIWDERNYTTDHKVMKRLQLSFNCCGFRGFDDYLNANETIPNSCCGKQAAYCNGDYAFQDGCANAVSSFFKSSFETIIYVTTGVAVLELIAFIFACCLAKQLRNKNKIVHREGAF